MNDLGMGITVSLKDMFSRNAGRIESSVRTLDATVASSTDRLARNMERIQQGAVLVGAGLAVLAIPATLVKSTSETQAALGTLRSLGVKDLRALEDAAEAFTNTWSGTTKPQFIAAAYDVRSALANLTDDAVGTFTAMAALTAKATKASTDEMVGTFTTAYGIFKPIMAELSDMGWARTFAGAMAQTVASFKTNGKQMADAIKNIGAVAAANKVPMEEQLAILGQLQTTMPGSEAGTLYKAFIMKAAEAGKELGLSLIDTRGRLKGVVPIIQEILRRYPDLSKADAQIRIKKAFGSDEAVKFLLQMSQGLSGLEANILSIRKAMKTGTAVTEEMARAMNMGLGAQVAVLQQRVRNLSEILGRTLLPVVMPLLRGFSDLVLRLQQVAKAMPGLTRGFLVAMSAAGTLLVSLGGVVLATGSLGLLVPAIKTGIATLGAALSGTGTALATYFWPVTLAVLSVIGLVWVLRRAWQTNFAGIADTVWGFAAKVGWVFQGVRALMTSLKDGVGQMPAELAEKLEAAGLMGLVTGIFRVYYRLREAFLGYQAAMERASARVQRILEPPIRTLIGAFGELFRAVGSVFGIFGQSATALSGDRYRQLGTVLGTLAGIMSQVSAHILKYLIIPLSWVVRGIAMVVRAVVWLGKVLVKGAVAGARAFYRYALPLRILVQGFVLAGKVIGTVWSVLRGRISVLDGLRNIGRAVVQFLLTPFRWARDVVQGLSSAIPSLSRVVVRTVAWVWGVWSGSFAGRWVKTAWEWGKQALKALMSPFSGLIPWLLRLLGGIRQAVAGWFGSGKARLKGGILGWLGLKSSGLGILGSLGSNLFAGLVNRFEETRSRLAGVWEAVINLGKTKLQMVGNLWRSLVQGIFPNPGEIVARLLGAFSAVQTVYTGLVGRLAGRLERLREQLGAVFASILSGWAALSQRVVGILGSVFGRVQRIATAILSIGQFITNISRANLASLATRAGRFLKPAVPITGMLALPPWLQALQVGGAAHTRSAPATETLAVPSKPERATLDPSAWHTQLLQSLTHLTASLHELTRVMQTTARQWATAFQPTPLLSVAGSVPIPRWEFAPSPIIPVDRGNPDLSPRRSRLLLDTRTRANAGATTQATQPGAPGPGQLLQAILDKLDALAERPIHVKVATHLDGRQIAESVYQDIREQKIRNYETL